MSLSLSFTDTQTHSITPTSVISSHKGPKQTKCKEKLARGCDVMEKKQNPRQTSVNFTADKNKIWNFTVLHDVSRQEEQREQHSLHMLFATQTKTKHKHTSNTKGSWSPHNKQSLFPRNFLFAPRMVMWFHNVGEKGQVGSSPSQLDVLHFFIQQVSLLPLWFTNILTTRKILFLFKNREVNEPRVSRSAYRSVCLVVEIGCCCSPAASPATTRHNALTDVTLPPRGCRCCLVSLGYCFWDCVCWHGKHSPQGSSTANNASAVHP